MKKYLYLNLVLLFVFTSSYSQTRIIQKGDTIHKEILFTFNQDAIDSEEFLTIEINKDFDFDNLTLLFNDKPSEDKTFKVDAKENKQLVSFKYFLKADAKKGNYKFNVGGITPSSGFNVDDIKYVPQFGFKDTEVSFPKSTKDKVLCFLSIVGIILLIIFITYLILKRDNMPLGRRTFLTGMITYTDGQLPSVRLEGENRYRYDISNALGIDQGIILEPYERYYNRKKRRFARLKNTSDAEISILYDDIEEMIGGAQELYHRDEIKIKTLDNKMFIIGYMNKKNMRI